MINTGRGYLVGTVGMQWGESCSCMTSEGEEIMESYPELAEIARTMALEAVLGDDLRHQWVVYPRREWKSVETDAVDILWN